MSEDNLGVQNQVKRRISEVIGDENLNQKKRRAEPGGAHSSVLQATQFNTHTRRRLSHEDYTVGWICALPLEMTAARAMLDEEHLALPISVTDHNTYILGAVAKHNVVIACLPTGIYGTTSATAVGLAMQITFPNAREMPLMVGIGGGVPSSDHDIRLGDIVVGVPSPGYPAVIQYDYGKTITDGVSLDSVSLSQGTLNKPAPILLSAVASLRAQHDLHTSQVHSHMSEAISKYGLPEYEYPGAELDILYGSDCQHTSDLVCETCGPQEIPRHPRKSNNPVVHYGSIASGNQVMKHARTRDRIARQYQHRVLCFEMEAAGLMDYLPCLVIRGICDYCDSYKHKQFQGYAALAAAAYAKELLLLVPVKDRSKAGEVEGKQRLMLEKLDLEAKEQRNHMIAKLDFEEADTRRATVKTAHSQTCEWILEQQEYVQWLDHTKYPEHRGLLWIKGKPGTGKSTIIKYILKCNEAFQSKTFMTISFFFNARGHDLEKSTSGMYRSLLLQLLSQEPSLESLLDNLKGNTSFGQDNLEVLTQLFKEALNRLHSRTLLCFVDALDECPEDQIREMVRSFEDLGTLALSKNLRLLVCFSSRHYPNISVDFGIQLILEAQHGHSQDLREYIAAELRVGRIKQAESLREAVLIKSNGIFLWVVLVVKILKRDYDRGRIHDMDQRLNQIPMELNELLKDILLRDQDDQSEFILCMQWILYSRRPLLREEFYFALLCGNNQYDLNEWEQTPQSVMDHYILDCSKGFAELTRGKKPSVQFIHESVREFLLRSDNRIELYHGFQPLSVGSSHQRLTECCQRRLAMYSVKGLDLPDESSWMNSDAKIVLRETSNQTFPLLEYAAQNVLWHAEQAQRASISQTLYLTSFDYQLWIDAYNITQKHRIIHWPTSRWEMPESRPTDAVASFLIFSGLENLFSLWAQLYQPDENTFRALVDVFKAELNIERFRRLYIKCIQSNHYYSRIVKSLKLSNKDLYQHVYALFGLVGSSIQTHWSNADRSAAVRYKKLISAIFRWHDLTPGELGLDLLFYAARQKDPAAMQLLLDHAGTLTAENAQKMLCETVRQLSRHRLLPDASVTIQCISMSLSRGACLDYRDTVRGSVLSMTTQWADNSVVRFLLNNHPSFSSSSLKEAILTAIDVHDHDVTLLLLRKVEPFTSKEFYNTALHAAVKACNKTAVKLVLDRGAEINAEDLHGQVALHLAAGHVMNEDAQAIINELLSNGAQVNHRDRDGNTPLHCLATMADEGPALQLLLEHGAKIDAQNCQGQSPLHLAVIKGVQNPITLLRENKTVANVKSEDHGRLTSMTVRRNSCHFVLNLLKHGAKVNIRDNQERTPLHMALHCMSRDFDFDWDVGKVLFEHSHKLDLTVKSVETDYEWQWISEYMVRVRSAGRWITKLDFVRDGIPNDYNVDDMMDYQIVLKLRQQQNEKRESIARAPRL